MKKIGELLPIDPGEGLVEKGGFEAFWSVCPRKTAKKDAIKAWEQLNEKDRLAATSGMVYHAQHNPQWLDQTLIPHPATFLRGRRWEDDIVVPRQQQVQEDANGDDPASIVWSAMTQIFGTPWLDRYGVRPPPVWRSQLSPLTPSEVQRGLRVMTDAGDQRMPSLPYFISLCKSRQPLKEFAALPRPEPDPQVVEAALAEMKKILREAKHHE